MNLSLETLQTHLFARMRDEWGNKMNLCTRLECCVNNECVAVFEGRWPDMHYYVLAALFQVFAGPQVIRINGTRINYSAHHQLEEIDRFDVGYYSFCNLIEELYKSSRFEFSEWRLVSMDKELFEWLQKGAVLDPHLLSFICAWQGERRVY